MEERTGRGGNWGRGLSTPRGTKSGVQRAALGSQLLSLPDVPKPRNQRELLWGSLYAGQNRLYLLLCSLQGEGKWGVEAHLGAAVQMV